MFELIISHIHTGKVERSSWATREQAETALQLFEEWLANRSWRGKPRPGSMRNYRVEVVYQPAASVVPVVPVLDDEVEGMLLSGSSAAAAA